MPRTPPCRLRPLRRAPYFCFFVFIVLFLCYFKKGHWKRRICIKLSENVEFTTVLRSLAVTYETKYEQFCANLARNLRNLALANAPFSGFLVLWGAKLKLWFAIAWSPIVFEERFAVSNSRTFGVRHAIRSNMYTGCEEILGLSAT